MKPRCLKYLLFVAVFFSPLQTSAQSDTIFGKSPRYHYSEWYDTLPRYFDHSSSPNSSPFSCSYCIAGGFDYHDHEAKEHYSADSIAVKGMSVMVTKYLNYTRDSNFYQPEYLMLGRFDSVNHQMTIISDSLRWDTVTPRIYKLDLCCHTEDSHSHCNMPVYEVFFSKPVIVDSSFYIVFTCNNLTNDPEHGACPIYKGIVGPMGYNYIYPVRMKEIRSRLNPDGSLYWYQKTPSIYYGGSFPIVDYYNLEARPHDDCVEMGTVTGSGRFSDYVVRHIRACPHPGYLFTHWNDGDISNPRNVILTQNTLFTAFFRPANPCHADILSSDTLRGSVTGTGDYLECDTVTISAVPAPGYTFMHWNDGNTSNPRSFVITRDTLFTATFRNLETYRMEAYANDHSRGFVTGGGFYLEYDTVTLTAVPRGDYLFHSWNDSSRLNPRTIVITQDTTFTAYFYHSESVPVHAASQPLFALTPNPAGETVTVSLSPLVANPAECRITLHDAAGHELTTLVPEQRQFTLATDKLPAGIYLVTLHSPQGTHTLRLVIVQGEKK